MRSITIDGIAIFIDDERYSPVIVADLERGSYEGGERGVLDRFLQPGDRVLEVGTALGLVAMVTARHIGDGNVYSFEANPDLVADAKRNFAANDAAIHLTNGVLKNRVHWTGEGSRSPFFIHEEFWASSLCDKPGTVRTIAVPNYCLEDCIVLHKANAIICDIEGGEIDLFLNASLVGISKLLLEIHYWAGRDGINRLVRKLVLDGFSINFDLSGGSIVAFER